MFDKAKQVSDYIKKITKNTPKTAIILGSGLGAIAERVQNKIEIPYEKIPNFPVTDVKGHSNMLIFGDINGVSVLLMKGRFHFYEGHDMGVVTFPIYVMKMLGIENIIVTNASGGINERFCPGTLMIINDFINNMGTNPLIGKNDDRLGVRFPDMTEPFSKDFIKKAKDTFCKLNIQYEEGVYLATTGPTYETRAEIKMFKMLGADCVGMSTVPETIVANYLGMKVLGISCITNMATGIQKTKHSHENVVETAQKVSDNLCKVVEEILKAL